jgi:hypothetical protein
VCFRSTDNHWRIVDRTRAGRRFIRRVAEVDDGLMLVFLHFPQFSIVFQIVAVPAHRHWRGAALGGAARLAVAVPEVCSLYFAFYGWAILQKKRTKIGILKIRIE